MPPYQPLAAPQMKLPDWFMNPQFTELNDAISANEKLRAQELVNQANDLKVQEAQRQNESDISIREKIKQYAMENPYQAPTAAIPPEAIGTNMDGSVMMSEGTPANPGRELLNSQRISQLIGEGALQAGDWKTALEAAKAGRENGANRLLTPDELAVYRAKGIDLPEGSTVQTLQLVNTIDKNKTYKDSIENSQERYDDKNARLLPEGYEGNPTNDDAKKFKETLKSHGNVSRILDDLSASLARTGVNAATGDDYVLQRQLVGDLAFELKSPGMGNLGAALSPSEYQLLLTQLPSLLASPETSLGKVLVERGMGRDPLAAISALRNKIDRILTIEEPIRKIRKIKTTEDSSGASQIPVAQPTTGGGVLDFSKAPPNMSPEQFKAWKAGQ